MDGKLYSMIPLDALREYLQGNSHTAGAVLGCVPVEEGKLHRFIVFAPNAQRVSLVGDFNAWDREANPMERLEGGFWCCFVAEVYEFQSYKYCVVQQDGNTVLKSDPCASFGQTRDKNASLVWNGGVFTWSDSEFIEKRAAADPLKMPVSIYEVHAGSWRKLPDGRPGWCALGDALAEYCTDMGYTHVELLPVTEYPFDGSWGYQVTGYFAPTSRYGTPDDFKYFVNRLHEAGIGVIMDWVPAHFPKDEHGLRYFDGTALYECKEPRMAEHPEWGTMIFDFASPTVRSFLLSSACNFIETYHVDGIRVDAVSSMIYLDYCRRPGDFTPNRLGGNQNLDAISFLQVMNKTLRECYPGVITIAEEATAFPHVTGATSDGSLGFTFKWDMGFMHDTLDYLSVDPIYRSYAHDKLTFSMVYCFSEHFCLAYSHDEVVHLKKSMIEKMHGSYELKFSNLRGLYAYQFAHPGIKLNFMGNEIGQFREWSEMRELDWSVLDYPMHKGLQACYRDLNNFYRSHPAMYEVDDSWDGFRWLNVDDRNRSSVAFLRSGKKSYVICAVNFTPLQYNDFKIALPAEGTLTEVFNTDAKCYGGTGTGNPETISAVKESFLKEMDYSTVITLPPMGAVYFEYKPVKKRAGKAKTEAAGQK